MTKKIQVGRPVSCTTAAGRVFGPLKALLCTESIVEKGIYQFGREAGIRTLGRVTPSNDFESFPFNHSGTSPLRISLTDYSGDRHPGNQYSCCLVCRRYCYNLTWE